VGDFDLEVHPGVNSGNLFNAANGAFDGFRFFRSEVWPRREGASLRPTSEKKARSLSKRQRSSHSSALVLAVHRRLNREVSYIVALHPGFPLCHPDQHRLYNRARV